ncbi:MAG: hypothetical protein FWF90_18450 [Promicromonosporaceae bacterium]|nr:hypothetical protein [Promicromonosporaceae bacterium]
MSIVARRRHTANAGDVRAVAQYQELVRTGPAGVLLQAQVEAFERLTPAQLDLLLEREAIDLGPVPAVAGPARAAARAVAKNGSRGWAWAASVLLAVLAVYTVGFASLAGGVTDPGVNDFQNAQALQWAATDWTGW